jgi:hypothetical protein
MRLTGIGLCAVFVAASSQAFHGAASQEPTRIPQEKSPFSKLFTVPPADAPKAPDWLQIDLSRVIRQDIRPAKPRVACGITVIEGDPNVDRKIVIPIPREGQNAKIRVISPPPCER